MRLYEENPRTIELGDIVSISPLSEHYGENFGCCSLLGKVMAKFGDGSVGVLFDPHCYTVCNNISDLFLVFPTERPFNSYENHYDYLLSGITEGRTVFSSAAQEQYYPVRDEDHRTKEKVVWEI